MRGFHQYAAGLRAQETRHDRARALDFAELCVQRGPQVAYEPSQKWNDAELALRQGWVYVEMLDADGKKTAHYVSNLTAGDIKAIRAHWAGGAG